MRQEIGSQTYLSQKEKKRVTLMLCMICMELFFAVSFTEPNQGDIFFFQQLQHNLSKKHIKIGNLILETSFHRQVIELIEMRRNKMIHLMQIKRIKYPHQKIKSQPIINHQYSQWQESYYHKKQILTNIQNTSCNIDQLITSYEHNPTVHNLKLLEKLVKNNCEKINSFDQILNIQQQYSNMHFMTSTMFMLNQNVNKNFKIMLFQLVKKLFQAKAQISEITNRVQEHQRSFNAFNNSQNISYASLNNRSLFPHQNRQETFNQVNQQIQGLSMILKRMNVMVNQQGELINQIDQNMKKGTQNIKKGKEMLEKRVMREQGSGQFQFSFQGKINQAISLIFGFNVFLIVIWVFVCYQVDKNPHPLKSHKINFLYTFSDEIFDADFSIDRIFKISFMNNFYDRFSKNSKNYSKPRLMQLFQ